MYSLILKKAVKELCTFSIVLFVSISTCIGQQVIVDQSSNNTFQIKVRKPELTKFNLLPQGLIVGQKLISVTLQSTDSTGTNDTILVGPAPVTINGNQLNLVFEKGKAKVPVLITDNKPILIVSGSGFTQKLSYYYVSSGFFVSIVAILAFCIAIIIFVYVIKNKRKQSK